jgi:hypothetical protein
MPVSYMFWTTSTLPVFCGICLVDFVIQHFAGVLYLGTLMLYTIYLLNLSVVPLPLPLRVSM